LDTTVQIAVLERGREGREVAWRRRRGEFARRRGGYAGGTGAQGVEQIRHREVELSSGGFGWLRDFRGEFGSVIISEDKVKGIG
jgi:hypothetical protein